MTTVSQIERLWRGNQFVQLAGLLARGRNDFPPADLCHGSARLAVAAMGMIRLDEMNQSHAPLFGTLLRVLLTSQDADGGWGDVVISALATRALLLGKGNGHRVELAVRYLALLQQPEGSWPSQPLRRMPADEFTTAFVLLQVGDNLAFAEAARVKEGIDWLLHRDGRLDEKSEPLWQRIKRRHRVGNSGIRLSQISRTSCNELWARACER